MNFLMANSFTTFFNNLFSNWKLVLFIVLTILLILTIFFKRFKITFFVLLASALVIGALWLGFFIYDAVTCDDYYKLIDFLIAWFPTILFSLIIVLSTLVGAIRGRRKSLIFLLHSAAAAIVWVVFYFAAVGSTEIDALLVKFVNLFMGENGLQKSLGVSEQADTFRRILTLYLQRLAGEGALGILVYDTSAYVYTLADMVYHIGFALISYLFYLLTVLILYIVYHCCYSDRKHKKKKMKEFGENNTDEPYKKHYAAGGGVGLARGLVAGILSLSFLGACFYMVAGRGEGKLKDIEASGKYENELRIYRSIESYGTQGIFMILNAMSDPDDMPYYLFAADLVFSGELDDQHVGVSENVHLSGEFGAFSGFARDTVLLLLEYGSEEIAGAVDGTSETGLMQSVLNVMQKEGFRQEFDGLIAEFESPTYIHNFSMSLVSSVLANIDSMPVGGSLSDKNKELVKIMFKEGYLSSYIPEDCALHDMAGEGAPWLITGNSVRPYLSLQQLIDKEDIRHFLDIFLTVLSDRSKGTETFDMIRSVTPKVQELSLFGGGKSGSVDPVLARVYCYLQNAYLKAEGASGYSYNALVAEKVAWTEEINKLLDVAEDVYMVYDDVKDAESAVFNRMLYIFDADNPNRNKDIELYDKISEKITSSRILGKTLATSFFRETLTDGLGQLFKNLYVPNDILYENRYSESGGIAEYGELHYFLKGLRHIGCMENQAFFEMLFGETDEELNAILSTIADVMKETDNDGNNFAYYASRSDLLRSVVSSFLIGEGEGVIYVPNAAYDTDKSGARINVVTCGELERLLNGMQIISSFVGDCVDGDYYGNIDAYLDNGEFIGLLETSRIVEGTLAQLVKDKLADENTGTGEGGKHGLIVPKKLSDDVENWCTQQTGGIGELRRFVNSYLELRNQAGREESGEGGFKLSLKNLMDGNQEELLLSTVSDLGKNHSIEEQDAIINEFLASEIIYYTVSDYMRSTKLNDWTVVVPASASIKLYNDVIDSVIRREELFNIFSRVNRLGIVDGIDATELLKTLIFNQDLIVGDILSASVVANIAANGDFRTVLRLESVCISDDSDVNYYTVGVPAYLREGYYYLNPWYEELPRLLEALGSLFSEQAESESFTFDAESMAKAMYDAKEQNPLAIQACRKSRIISVGYAGLLDMADDAENPTE